MRKVALLAVASLVGLLAAATTASAVRLFHDGRVPARPSRQRARAAVSARLLHARWPSAGESLLPFSFGKATVAEPRGSSVLGSTITALSELIRPRSWRLSRKNQDGAKCAGALCV